MAAVSFVTPAIGRSNSIHTEQKNPLGYQAIATDGSVWVYLKGVASTVEGSWVTFDSTTGVTALLAANAVGPVAVAGAALVASTFGWYLRDGKGEGMLVTATLAGAVLGRETTDGMAGDGTTAGDIIYNAWSREANASGGTVLSDIEIHYPFVDDLTAGH